MCLLVAAPLIMLLRTWLVLDAELWQHLWDTQLSELLVNTLILFFGVGAGVAIVGLPLAWLTVNCQFPGRSFFDWALILPLAIPAYVLAFVALGMTNFDSAIQTGLRSLGYSSFIDARHPIMVIWVMTAVLYPYVYLLVRAAFLAQGSHLLDVARSLGRSPIRAFFEVSLPAVRPALVAAMSLALMEALADFGAVSIFGFNTFTTAIYKSWLSLFSLQTAAQLATLLLLFVMLCLYAEKTNRKTINTQGQARSHHRQAIHLKGGWKWFATGICSLVLIVTVVVPFVQLIVWAWPQASNLLDDSFIQLIIRTCVLGLSAALLVVCLSVLIAAVQSNQIGPTMATEFASLGYALPGSVLAIGIMLCFAFLDQLYVGLGQLLGNNWQPVFLGSLAGLLVAYLIRFFRPGFAAVCTGFASVNNHHLESAALMGSSSWQRFWRITLPLILPGLLTGGLIVFVDVIKEMPASLLLRPFGWDTLATKLYELTSEGEWQRAAVPALMLVLVSLAPVILLIKGSKSKVQRLAG